MIKYIFFLVFFLTSKFAIAQFTVTIQWQSIKRGSAGDTIYYQPDRKLIWSDFRGKPDKNSPAAAITESGFGYRMSMNSYNSRTDVLITVFCYFNKKKSWVKKDMDNDYALTHEQHHYDITYINACLFVQKLKEANFNKGNYNYLVEKIHDDTFATLDKMQDDYDGQTLNGRIERQQKIWNKKIDSMLAELIIN